MSFYVQLNELKLGTNEAKMGIYKKHLNELIVSFELKYVCFSNKFKTKYIWHLFHYEHSDNFYSM